MAISKDLYIQFTKEYDVRYRGKIESLKKKYPLITRPTSRTGKALEDICFFICQYASHENDDIIDVLLWSSILLAAQDDFFDNPAILQEEKKEFYDICEHIIAGEQYELKTKNQQPIELIGLWADLSANMSLAPSHLYQYWQQQSLKLNKAMMHEISMAKETDLTLVDYMKVAKDSIGIMFVWAAYLAKKDISKTMLDEVDVVLDQGACVARLANDLAGYRRKKNSMNAVTVTKESRPVESIKHLMQKEYQAFSHGLQKIQMPEMTKKTIKDSVDFLVRFYSTSDFGV